VPGLGLELVATFVLAVKAFAVPKKQAAAPMAATRRFGLIGKKPHLAIAICTKAHGADCIRRHMGLLGGQFRPKIEIDTMSELNIIG
jgi:hypothetical protein